jgi:tRNA(Phe) wybutosine-synthesizing methylase Tyw3
MLTFPTPIPLTERCQLYVRSAYKVIYEAAMKKDDEINENMQLLQEPLESVSRHFYTMSFGE